MNYLCEEIVIEILRRLPAKSLVRFMAVCRLWKSIITIPQFQLSSKRPTKLLVHTDRECYSLVEDDEDQNQNLLLMFETDFNGSALLIGSDNGLLCICTRDPKKEDYFYSRVIIWNPSIRKHVVIPNNPMYDDTTHVPQCAYGFGGTISGSDYKYVSVVGLIAGGRWEKAVDVYSLKTGLWRRKHLDWDNTMDFLTFTCALLRGRLHWAASLPGIFSFELEDEVFEDIIVLPKSIVSHIVINVTVIRESLAVIANEKGGPSAVWVMEEYGDVDSWIKLCNIDLNKQIIGSVAGNMVHLLKNGELLLGLLGEKYPYYLKLVTYNPKTMETRHLGGELLSPKPQACGFSHYYKESLVLLGDDRAAENQQPALQERQHGFNPVMAGGACSYTLDQNWSMFFKPLHAYFPVWTGGAGFQWYPLFQDQCGSYYARNETFSKRIFFLRHPINDHVTAHQFSYRDRAYSWLQPHHPFL